MLGNFYAFFNEHKNPFRNTIRVSNGLGPNQDRHFVGPDLGPNLFANEGYQQRWLFSCFCCHLMTFFFQNKLLQQNSFRNTIRVECQTVKVWITVWSKLFAKVAEVTFSYFCCCPLTFFFQNKFFQQILSGTLSECSCCHLIL